MLQGVLTFILITICVASSFSKPGDYSLTEESRLYTKISDVELATAQGRFRLSEVYGQSPVMIAFIFTRCSGICSPFLLRLNENIKALSSKINFRVLVVSFDSADSLADMVALAQRYGLTANSQWLFATTRQINELNTSVGFHPVWDSTKRQYDHEALLVGVNENGYIVKKLTGIREPRDLLVMIKEINNDFVLSYPLPRKNMLFSCFTYNPATGEKKASLGLVVLLLPALITLLLLFWFSLKKQEANRAS
ncbi:MAG: SCO family protein [Bacteroidetes bacterium]|nr:SCO family protein [Bacteroidota bacterium]MBS1540831.1 SCO family protein [Bacteroidota bacterium]